MTNVHLNVYLRETQQLTLPAYALLAWLRGRRLLQRLITARLSHLKSLAPPPPPSPAKWGLCGLPTNACRHVYHMLLTCDGSLGSPIVYSLILHTRQTLMTAINRRRRDGGPVRDQPSQQWFIGLTIVRAGLLVHRPTSVSYTHLTLPTIYSV